MWPSIFSLINVKGSCPMSYQYLTMKMVNKAKTNDGFVDQKMFKTAGKYGFDCLYLTETSMQVLDGSINHIRPLLRPTCDFVLATRNGGQNVKVGGLMSKLVFDATGKYVQPTRYQQIVETASSRQLSSSAQSTISEYQKHNSVVASVHYQKQRSREVQVKHMNICKDCMETKGQSLKLACARGVQAILRPLKIEMVAKLILRQTTREKRSQKHHPSVFQLSQD